MIRGTAREIDVSRLTVQSDQLHYAVTPGAAPQPLVGHEYMLFFIEARVDRDDWRRLAAIEEPLDQAIKAIINGEDEKAASFSKVALWNAMSSPDLAVHDRRRVAMAIKAELAQLASDDGTHGAVPDEEVNLATMMARSAPSVEDAMALGKLTPEELFAS